MSSSLEHFKTVIRGCTYDNTYKMAWARSVVELASTKTYSQSEMVTITLEEIAACYMKYYWDQTIFFDLIQGSNLIKPPKILTYTKELIAYYYEQTESNKPERFVRINLDEKVYNSYIKKFVTVLKQDVSWRFLRLEKEVYDDIYCYEKGDNELTISGDFLAELKANERDLYDLINYRWGMILESFNSSPRINKKVKIIDEQEIKRAPLTKFKKYLDLENPEHVCFICGEPIDKDNLSIDHVIPWSYMYSDDLWNLVYVHKGCNSSKSNRIPNEATIERLKARNKVLLENWTKLDMKTDKLFDTLKLCINHDYVDKFWVGCKE